MENVKGPTRARHEPVGYGVRGGVGQGGIQKREDEKGETVNSGRKLAKKKKQTAFGNECQTLEPEAHSSSATGEKGRKITKRGNIFSMAVEKKTSYEKER